MFAPLSLCSESMAVFLHPLLSGRRILALAMVERPTAETWEDKGYVGVCHVLPKPGDKTIDLHDHQFIFEIQIWSLNGSPSIGMMVIMKCII